MGIRFFNQSTCNPARADSATQPLRALRGLVGFFLGGWVSWWLGGSSSWGSGWLTCGLDKLKTTRSFFDPSFRVPTQQKSEYAFVFLINCFLS